MIDILKEFENRPPEIVLSWNDQETDAKGWLVINSLRGGAAGGGTRMKKGISLQDVELLAKTMEIKFTVSGPQIGGAKSGIDFDPIDPRRDEVLMRWYKAVFPMLKKYYGTGGDLNVDFITDVVPMTKELGIDHPQEGILAGHFKNLDKTEKINALIQGTGKIVKDEKYSPDPEGGYSVADLISGYSVAQSVIHYYKILDENHDNKKAIIQGWGNVGSAAGYFLTQSGVKVIGIFEKYGGVFNQDGFDLSDIRRFLLERKTKKFSNYQYIPFHEMNKIFWDLPADIFIPAAASKLITRNHVDQLIQSGIHIMICGANVPFSDDGIFFGPTAEFTDQNLSMIPDFIANCGMARVFAYLMGKGVEITEKAIFEDVSETVMGALENACNARNPTNITKNAFKNALEKLE